MRLKRLRKSWKTATRSREIYISNHSTQTCLRKGKPNQWQRSDSRNFLANKRPTEMMKRNFHHVVRTMRLFSQASDHQTNILPSDKSKRNLIKQFEITLLEMMQTSWDQVHSAATKALSDKNKSMSSKPETSGHIRAVIGSITRSRVQ